MHLKLILSNNPKTVSAFVMRSLHPDNNRLKAKEYGLMRFEFYFLNKDFLKIYFAFLKEY